MSQTKTSISKNGITFVYSNNNDTIQLLAGDDPKKLYLDSVTEDNAVATIADVKTREPKINLTVGRAVITTTGGGLSISTTTATEIGYLSGVTSLIQTQLNSKSPKEGSSELVTVGTVTTGEWNANVISPTYGGTGENSLNNVTVGRATSDASGNVISMTYATKSEVATALTSSVNYKGSKPTFNDLPSSGNKVGDLWNVTDTGMNYAWTGSTWDAMSTVYGIFSTTSNGLMPKVVLPQGADPNTRVYIRSDASWVTGDTSITSSSTNNTFPGSKAVWDAMVPRELTSTKGDMIYASNPNVPTRLSIGSSGQFLSVSNGIPTWSPNPTGVLKLIVGKSTSTVDEVAANGEVTLRFLNDTTNKNSHLIVGTGATTVISDALGKITIDTTYVQGDGINITGTTISNSGVRSVATGSTNGTISVNTNGTATDVPVYGLGDNAYNSTHIPVKVAKTASDDTTYDIPFINPGAANTDLNYSSDQLNKLTFNPSTGTLISFNYATNFTGDLAEDIVVINSVGKIEPGYCYAFDGVKYFKTSKIGDSKFIGINSDTAGYVLNARTGELKLRIGLSGFVLAHVKKEYKPMTPLVCGCDGILVRARLIDKLFNKVIGYYWKPEAKDTWGQVKVNDRHWVKLG